MLRLVKLARPLGPLVAVTVPPRVAPPLTDAVTVTPLTLLLLASSTLTTGWVASTTPLCAVLDGWVNIWIVAAAPAVNVMVPEVAEVNPVAENCRVYDPALPLRTRLVKAATPEVLVVTVTVPPSVAVAGATAAVTETPACETGLPAPSLSWTTGC